MLIFMMKKYKFLLFPLLFFSTITHCKSVKLLFEEEKKDATGHIISVHKVFQNSKKVKEIKELYGTDFAPLEYAPLPETYLSSPKVSNASTCPYEILDKNWKYDGVWIPNTLDCVVMVITHASSHQVLVFDVYRDDISSTGPTEILCRGLGEFKKKIKTDWSNVEVQLISRYHSPHLKKLVELLKDLLKIKHNQIKGHISGGAITKEDVFTTSYLEDDLTLRDFEKGIDLFISKEGKLSIIPATSL